MNYLEEFLWGAWLTASASVLAFAGSLIIGLLGAVASRSRFWLLRSISTVYVEVVRNVPSLVIIYFIFFGLPSAGILLPGYVAGVIALAINTGAYLVVTIRTGIQEVPAGQLEAARTLGLSRRAIFFDIVVPQAARTVYPPMVNELIQIILGSSLLSAIAVNELTGVALIVNGQTFQTMQAFATALVLYLILTNLTSFGADRLSRALFRAPLTKAPVKLRQGLIGRLLIPGGTR